jgi:hypothetical protein
MKTIASLLCCTLLATLASLSAYAATDVKVNVRARVKWMDDPANILNGQVQVGDVFEGSYSYDSSTPGQPLASNQMRYYMTGSMTQLRLASGPTVFETQTPDSWSFVDVTASDLSQGPDGIQMGYGSLRALPNGATVQHVSFRFYEPSGSAPITTALPTTAPNLQHWWERSMHIGGGLNSNYYMLELVVEATTLEPPQVIEFSPAPGRFLPQQRFDAALLLPVGSTIVSAQASVRGVPLLLSYPGTCTLAPPNSEGRPAILCPDAHTALNPAATHVDWSVELTNGTTLNKSVEWKLIQ